MLIEVSHAEYKHLWDWYVMPKNGVPYDDVFGNLLNRMKAYEPTMTLPGPDGEPNVDVPQDFFS